jgi:hypothetical protein
LAALRDTPYLRLLALFVVGGALVQSLLDYALGAEAVAAYGRGPRLLSFFAVFQTAVGVLSFLLQSTANRPALERLGIGGTMALLPASVAGFGVVAAAVPALVTTALQRGAEGVLRASLFRSAYEVLFTPVPQSLKRTTKTMIDVSFDRAGVLLGSGLTLGLTAVWPRAGVVPVTVAAVIACAAELVLAYRLHRGYVDTLAQRLRSGVLHIDVADIVDRTTRKTVSRTIPSLDRTALLVQIEALRAANAAPGEPEPPARAIPANEAPSDAVARALDELRSDQSPAVRTALAGDGVRNPLLAPQLLQLLGRDDLARDAMRALSAIAPRVVGTIADALLDEARAPRARRRAARLLGGVACERSIHALTLGLDAGPLEVRHACGRSLVEIRARNGALAFDAAAMFARATRELEARLEDPRSMEHVFDVLSLTAPIEPIQLAYGALQSPDAFLSGVALEYLEVVLPAEVRTAMMARLTPVTAPAERAAPRPSARSLDDLLRSEDRIRSFLRELRRERDPD